MAGPKWGTADEPVDSDRVSVGIAFRAHRKSVDITGGVSMMEEEFGKDELRGVGVLFGRMIAMMVEEGIIADMHYDVIVREKEHGPT